MMAAFLKMREFIEKQSDLNVLLFIIVLAFFCYLNIFFGHEFISYDDAWYIYENKNVINLSWQSIVESFTSLKNAQYSPIAEVYHAVIYFFFEKNAVSFKFFALLTHLLNVVLVFKLFSYLSSNRWLVIFVSLVFAIHPIQVEVIGWISVIYRITVLFMLLGCLFYCKYLQSNYNWRYLALVILFFILALITKEQAVLFPIALVLINLKKGAYLFQKRIIYENILFGLMSVTFAFITVEIVKTGGLDFVDIEIKSSFFRNIALFSEIITTYFYNFLLPINLSFFYTYPLIFVPSPVLYIRFFIALCIIVFAVIACVKHKKYRFGIFWTFGFLSIAISFSFYHIRPYFMADRYIYFAIIGLAYTLFLVLKRTHSLQVLGSLFIVMLMVMTINRVPVFKNSYVLYKDAIQKNNKNYFAYDQLTHVYYQDKDYNKAIRSAKKSVKCFPKNIRANTSLANIYLELGKHEDALKYTNILSELSPDKTKSDFDLSTVYLKMGKYDEALKHANIALKLSSDKADAHVILSEIYLEMKKYEDALKHANIVLELSSEKTNAHLNLGKIYLEMKRYEDALIHANSVLELSPDYAKGYSNRVAINSNLNRHEDAIKDLDYLLTKEPSDVKFLMARAISYFKLRNFEKSIEDCKKIIRIKDHDYAFYLLGHSQFLLNQYKAAEENLTKAITMDNKKGNYYFFRSHSRLSLGKFDLAYEDVLSAQKYRHPVSQNYFERVANLAKK